MFLEAFVYITKCTLGIEAWCGFHMESNYHNIYIYIYIKKVFKTYCTFFNSNFGLLLFKQVCARK